MNSKPDDFINGIQDLPLALHNLHQVVVKCDPKSGGDRNIFHIPLFMITKMWFDFRTIWTSCKID